MKELRLEITIDRPPQAVFDFVLNPENTPKWIDGFVHEEAAPLPVQIGTIYKNQNREGKWTEYEITALDPGKMFVLSRRDGSYHVKYILTPDNGRTRLEYFEWVDEGEIEEPFRLEVLQKLKLILENA